MRSLFAWWVARADDQKLERRFGSPLMLRAMFTAMGRLFDADAAAGFEGRLCYVLTRPETGRPPISWTLTVAGRRARARPGNAKDAAVTLRITLGDFVRIAARTIDPATPVLQGRAAFQGDFGVAVRLPEMFGASRSR
jgi:hypothetical protein